MLNKCHGIELNIMRSNLNESSDSLIVEFPVGCGEWRRDSGVYIPHTTLQLLLSVKSVPTVF